MYNYNSYGYQPMQNPYPEQPYQSVLNSNVIKVTSLDEAIMRTNMRNCEMVYFDQNGKNFYIVRVDGVGNKSWDVLSYGASNANTMMPATKEEFSALAARVEALEKKGSGDVNA